MIANLRNTLFTLLATLAGTLAAQDTKVRVKVKVDLGQKPDAVNTIHTLIKADDGALVALKVPARLGALGGVPQNEVPWSLMTLSRADMLPIKEAPHKILYGVDPVSVETIIRFHKKMLLFGSKIDRETSGVMVIAQEMNPRSLTPLRGAELLATIPFDRFGKGPEWFVRHAAVGFDIQLASDSGRFVLTLSPERTTLAGAPHFAAVFNKDRSLYWAASLQPEPARQHEVLSSLLDEHGAMWYLVKQVTDENPKDKTPGHHFAVYRVDSLGQAMAKLELAGKEYAQDVRMKLRKDGRLVLGGVYGSTDMQRNEAKGIFMTTLDRTQLEWGSIARHAYTLKKEQDREVPQVDMVVEDVLTFGDNGTVVVTDERALRSWTSKNFANQVVNRQAYINRDLHIMRLNATGDQVWYRTIARNVSLPDGRRGDPIAFQYADIFYLLMNDDLKNEPLRKAGTPLPALESGGEALLFEFKSDGSTKPRAVVNDRYDQGYVVPENLWRVAPNELCLLAVMKLKADRTFPVSFQFE